MARSSWVLVCGLMTGLGGGAAAAPPVHARMGQALEDLGALTAGAGAEGEVWEAALARQEATTLSFTPATQAAQCAECHEDEFAQWASGEGTDMPPVNLWDSLDEAAWDAGDLAALDPTNTRSSGSMHSLAMEDYYFQLILHEQPSQLQAMCLRCHMPQTATVASTRLGVYAPKANSATAANADEGVSCVGCHLSTSGQILGPEAKGGPHGVAASPAFADGITLCANCHNSTVYGSFTRTADEHAAQVTEDLTCVKCHMEGEGVSFEGGHAVPGGNSPAYRQRALSLTVPTSVSSLAAFEVQVRNVGAGHNAPTGDVFRAFSLTTRVTNSSGAVVVNRETFFTPLIKTPAFSEVVDYERMDPIPYLTTSRVSYGTLAQGTYSVTATITYYQTKPTTLAWTNGEIEDVAPYNVSTVESVSATLTVTK